MKLLVSSKNIAHSLNRLGEENINLVTLRNNELKLKTDKKEIIILARQLSEEETIITKGIRWDWVKQLLNLVPEQPVTMEISKNRASIMFEY